MLVVRVVMDSVVAARGFWANVDPSGVDITGYYLIPHRRRWLFRGGSKKIQGRLVLQGDYVAVFVKNPPRRGVYEHQHCLQYVGSGWFRLHFERAPKDFESAVVFTERFLERCMEG